MRAKLQLEQRAAVEAVVDGVAGVACRQRHARSWLKQLAGGGRHAAQVAVALAAVLPAEAVAAVRAAQPKQAPLRRAVRKADGAAAVFQPKAVGSYRR